MLPKTSLCRCWQVESGKGTSQYFSVYVTLYLQRESPERKKVDSDDDFELEEQPSAYQQLLGTLKQPEDDSEEDESDEEEDEELIEEGKPYDFNCHILDTQITTINFLLFIY